MANPTSINVDTFNTSDFSNESIETMIKELFDLNPSQIISKLGLKNSIYKRFASYGHFGREYNCSWEKINMVNEIKEFMKNHD